MPVPRSRWHSEHLQVDVALGTLADGKWYLKVTDQAGKVLFEGKDLPCGPEFDRIQWLGFVSNGTEAAEMYLDNVKMTRVEQ